MINNACIKTLFEIFVYGKPQDKVDSATLRQSIGFLLNNEMIEQSPQHPSRKGPEYTVTEKAKVWLNAVANLPLPEAVTRWHIPPLESDEEPGR
jgi:hypothetical protein